jgi:hypothetical protein
VESGVGGGGVTGAIGDEERVVRDRVGEELLEVCEGRERVHLDKVSEQSMFNKSQLNQILRARGPCARGV